MHNFFRLPLKFLKNPVDIRRITLRLFHKHELNDSCNADLFQFHEELTGEQLDDTKFTRLAKMKPKLAVTTKENLSEALNTLKRLGMDVSCIHEHYRLLILSPRLLQDRFELLQESGFKKITVPILSRFLHFTRQYSIAQLKQADIIDINTNVKEKLLESFERWPETHPVLFEVNEEVHSLIDVRVKILQMFLDWKLSMSENDFMKYLKCYYTIKFKSFAHIQEVINFEENELKLSASEIKKNGFLMTLQPKNVKEIFEIGQIAGVSIKLAIKKAPGLLLSTRENILKLKEIYKNYNIPEESLSKCVKVFSYSPCIIAERLEKLSKMEEFEILLTHPRFPEILTRCDTAMKRLEELKAKKRCYSFTALISSTREYQRYLNNLGSNVTSRDHAAIICSTLKVDYSKYVPEYVTEPKNIHDITLTKDSSGPMDYQIKKAFIQVTTLVLNRHIYHNTIPHKIVFDNLCTLKKYCNDDAIYNNIHLLFYPLNVVETIVKEFKRLHAGGKESTLTCIEPMPIELDFTKLTDDNLLSLVLYAIQKKYHFSDKGVWMNTTET